MIITAYHGTYKKYVSKILREKSFNISTGNKEWLGHGIYFYPNYKDARVWIKNPNDRSVLHVVIDVPKKYIIDFDTDIGKKVLNRFINLFVKNGLPILSCQENQCAIMNIIWASRAYKVFMGSFATRPSLIPMLTDARQRRPEICIRDNKLIKNINMI